MKLFGGGRKPTEAQVQEALSKIQDPLSQADIVSAGVVEAISLRDQAVSVSLIIDPAKAEEYEPIRAQAQQALSGLGGVSSATVVLTAASKGAAPEITPRSRPAPPTPTPIPGVKRVVAVGSGKGGVGKSTVSANLAVAMAAQGWKVGLLDADIYGPSQPRMMGLEGCEPPKSRPIAPYEAFGVKVMSMGFIAPPGEALVWRGPMLMKAMTQLVRDVAWGELDILIVDLPPGTGDVQISLSQRAEIDGAVIVSTPQDIALLDARRAITMFDKIQTPILGVIENMSSYVCPSCGHESHPFGSGGAQAEAEKIGAPYLGDAPLDLATRTGSDEGAPIATRGPDEPQAARFYAIARRLMDRLSS